MNLPIGRPKRVMDRRNVLELRAKGLSYRQIASSLGIGEGTVRRILRPVSDHVDARQNLAAEIL